MARYSVSLTIKENGRTIEERPLFDADERDDVEEMVSDIEDVVGDEDDGDEDDNEDDDEE